MSRSEDEGAAAAARAAKLVEEALGDTTLGDGAAPPPAGAGPSSIGRFEIHRKLGEGGMGAVYLATDPTLGRRVAIKVLRRDGVGDVASSQRRLLREAQGTAQLSHEHVVVVHEVGTHDGQVYLAMEYVAGTTLTTWQADRSWREILAMYRRAGQGLRAAHDAGLVHRDFKPDNVLVGDDGRVRVTDFGLVAAIDDVALNLSHASASLRGELDLAVSMTRTGTIMGTPRYMAPEQHLGQAVDARADQFAFCVALYEAWYRQPPFAGHSYEVLLGHVLAGEVVPVPATSEVPTALRDVVLRGLRRQRDDRWPSMPDLLAALVEAPVAVAIAVAAPPGPRRRRWPWLAGAVVVAVAVAVGGYGLRGGAAPRRDALDTEIAVLRDPRAARPLRLAAVSALAASSEERAAQALTSAMRTSDDAEVQAAAARALSSAASQIATALEPPVSPSSPSSPSSPPGGARPWAEGVSADDQKAALALFTQGNALLRDRKFALAAEQYRLALAYWDHPAIQFNLALALVNLDDPVNLNRALVKAMRYGAAPMDDDKFERARTTLVLVNKQLTNVEFAGVTPDVTLVLDGADVFTGPGPYHALLRAGRHLWSTRVGTHTSAPRAIFLEGGTVRKLTEAEVGLGD